jgi:hypothetical protein
MRASFFDVENRQVSMQRPLPDVVEREERVGARMYAEPRGCRPQVEILRCDEILDALGGTAYLSRVFLIQKSAVAAWRKNGIPASRCLALAEIAVRKKLPHFTVETLIRSQPASAFEPLSGSSIRARRNTGGTKTS